MSALFLHLQYKRTEKCDNNFDHSNLNNISWYTSKEINKSEKNKQIRTVNTRIWKYLIFFSHFSFSLLQNLASLLYKAAADGGYIDPHKVQEILGVSNTSSAADETITGQCGF